MVEILGAVSGVAPGDFLRDTSLVPDPIVPGRYHGIIPEAWKIRYAFGGVTMGVSMRAMQTHLDRPDLSLITANTVFSSPIPCGPITIDVTVLRSGRTAAQVGCDLRVTGEDQIALRTHSVFGSPQSLTKSFVDIEFPSDVKPPDECPPPMPPSEDNPWKPMNFHEQNEWRPAMPHFFDRTTWKPGPARFASWTRLLNEPRLEDGTYDPIALAIPGDSIGSAIGAKFGPTDEAWMTLSLEIGLRIVSVPIAKPAWVLQEITAWQSSDGYVTGPSRLWDAEGNLLAIATQTALLRAFNWNKE